MESKDGRFRSIYTCYMPLLRWIAKQKGIPYDEIDDLVQETFTEFFDHYPLTWPEHKIRASLAKIMKNLCTDYRRKCGTRLLVYMDPLQMQEQGTWLKAAGSRDTLSIVLERMEYREVLEAILAMKREWALVFILYVIQERPMKEVAKMLGISDAACRTRLMRGRKYLRSKFGEEPDYFRDQIFLRLRKPPGTSGASEAPGNA